MTIQHNSTDQDHSEIGPLLEYIPPPSDPKEIGTQKSWGRIEARLGLALPSDYKTLISNYGTGSFGNLINVYNPFAQNEYLNLFYILDTLHQADQHARHLGNPHWTAVDPFEYYPASDGLLPWGCTNNMHEIFCWQIKGKPETWETIFYNLGSGEYEVWKYPMTVFMCRLLTRQIESVLLVDDFLPTGRRATFIPLD